MTKIIIILLFFPTFVFASDCDKNSGSYSCEYSINGRSSPDLVQNGAKEIQAISNSTLDSLNIIVCTPKDKKLLLGQFAFPDTLLTCYSSAQTTFVSQLIQLFSAGFRISQIQGSGGKVLYYMERK
jgi:hypothetical protein